MNKYSLLIDPCLIKALKDVKLPQNPVTIKGIEALKSRAKKTPEKLAQNNPDIFVCLSRK